MARDGLGELAAWADERMPRLIEDAYAAILDRVEIYRADQPVPSDDLRRSVARNVRAMIAAIGHPDDPLDLEAAQDTGRRRAHQGVPLPEVLRAYRISFATLWDAFVEHARRGRRPSTADTLLTAASMIWQLTDEHATALTEAYRAATAELLLTQQQRRSALVEALLTGHPRLGTGPWDAAALLGLAPDTDTVVVAAETSGVAEETLPGIERHLADKGITSAWRLTTALQLGLVSLHEDQRDTVLDLLREVAGARTGVSPLYRSLTDSPRALQLARNALATLPTGRPGVRMFGASPLAALMARDPDEARRLAQDVLGPVLDQSPDDRAVLLDTLNAYLDHHGSNEHAAKTLYCHPNTIRYRLRRIHDLTGRSTTDPHELAELATAAYALRIPAGTARRVSVPVEFGEVVSGEGQVSGGEVLFQVCRGGGAGDRQHDG